MSTRYSTESKTPWGSYLRSQRIKNLTPPTSRGKGHPVSQHDYANWLSKNLERRVSAVSYISWELGNTEPNFFRKAEIKQVIENNTYKKL
jgi:hypothetical protein